MRSAGYVVVLILIAVVLAMAPGLDGYYFKNNYLSLLRSMSADSPSKIQVVQYRLGWLHSKAKLKITFKAKKTLSGTAGDLQTVTIDQVITHGPLFKDPATATWVVMQAMIDSKVHIDKKYEDPLLGANADNGVMQINTMVNFLNKYASTVQTPVFTLKLSNDAKITWQGIKGTVDANVVNNNVKAVKTNLTGGPFNMQDTANNTSIAAQGLTVQADKTCEQGELCSGTGSMNLPAITFVTPDKSIKATGINFQTNYGVDAKNVYTGKLQINFAKYEVPDYTVGPASFKFDIDNVDGAAVQKIMAIAKSMPDADSNSRAEQLILLSQYNNEIPHLITASTIINENVNVKTSYGDFKSTGKFSWPANSPLPNNMTDLSRMNIKINLRAATALVDQVISALDAKETQSTEATNTSASAGTNVTNATATSAAPTSVPQSFEGVVADLVTKGLSTDEQRNLLELNKKHATKQVFNAYVDSRVAVKLIPANMGDQLKQVYNPSAITQNASVANKQLEDWVQQKKITDDTRDALNELQKQHFSSVIYDSSIDDLVKAKKLPADLGAQLKAQYDDATANNEVTIPGDNDTTTTAATPVVAGRQRLQFDAWVKQGFVKQDKDDYVVDIDYENSVLKINDVTIPLPPAQH